MTYVPEKQNVLRAEKDLISMLKMRRPGGSRSERKWINQWIAPLGGERDGYGNLLVKIGESSVIWSCHTDTVHKDGGEQRLLIQEAKGFGRVVRLSENEKQSNCLGADCTTGAWIMREMILAKVPGLYIFHRDEETGGGGSSWIAKHKPDLLMNYKFAIAFDRKGQDSVISHQFGGRCSSQEFIDSIAPMLPKGYTADDGGSFTDTANYTDDIGECSNLSVGYYGQHTAKEMQLLDFALELRESMLSFDESKLVSHRLPGEADWTDIDYGRYDNLDRFSDKRPASGNWAGWERSSDDDDRKRDSLVDFCSDYPHEVADYLEQMGVNVQDLYDANPQLSQKRHHAFNG